jgi:polyisoprenoid-binding protein YceI
MNVQFARIRGWRVRSRASALSIVALLACVGAAAQEAGERYVVDAAQSDLHWLVYRAGAFSRFGHNHTVAVGDLSGSVLVNRDDLAKSRLELQFSVANLVVDDPALRSTLGEEFSSVPKEEDVAGTRRNMLSERVLDGDKYPQIRITGTGPVMAGAVQELAVEISMLGRVIDLKVPTEVTIEGDRLRAKGEFELNHADLGMEPFSVMAGALQVGEKLSFTYDVAAQRAAPRAKEKRGQIYFCEKRGRIYFFGRKIDLSPFHVLFSSSA